MTERQATRISCAGLSGTLVDRQPVLCIPDPLLTYQSSRLLLGPQEALLAGSRSPVNEVQYVETHRVIYRLYVGCDSEAGRRLFICRGEGDCNSFHAVVGCCKPSLAKGGCTGPCLLIPFPRDSAFLGFVQLETFSPGIFLLLHLFLHFLAQKKREVYL